MTAPARIRLPPGRAQAREAGHQIDPAVVLQPLRHRLGLAASEIIPTPSLSHWIADPAEKIDPSSA